MKYGNLRLDKDKDMENIGDWVQILAIENLYHYMHLDYKEVVRINISELSTYDGDYVLLPINYPFYGYYDLSPKIIPVYLGISIMSHTVAPGLKMQKFQPVGCRDIHTWKELQKAQIDAYYGGCLTIAFPKRAGGEQRKKTFIVDVTEKVLQQIPESIRENAEYVTHLRYGSDCIGEEGARDIFKRYQDEGALVITSRIHCAQPCLAMGIPVIFICETVSFRYDVLKNLIPIYTLETVKDINWNPESVELEIQKENLLKYAAERVLDTYKKYSLRCEISSFYQKGRNLAYKIDSIWAFQEYIKKRWKTEDYFQYSLWGVTQSAEIIYEWISENYKNASLSYVVDAYRKIMFHGIATSSLDALEKDTDVVFVTAGSANPVAEQTFSNYKVKHYVICYGGLYIIDGKRLE